MHRRRHFLAALLVLLLFAATTGPIPSPAGAESCADYVTHILQPRDVGQNYITVNWSTTLVGGQPASGRGRLKVHAIGTNDFYYSDFEATASDVHLVTLTGLNMSTDYEVQHQTDFDGDGDPCGSPWVAFRTDDPPPPCEYTISNLTTSSTTSSVTVAWESSPEATGRIRIRRTAVTTDPWFETTFTSLGTSHTRTVAGLYSGTSYTYHVQMRCPATGVVTTEWFGTVATQGTAGGGGKGGPYPYQPAITRVWPNPASDRATLRFVLPAEGRVLAEVFDLNGRHIARLADRVYPAGEFQVDWNGRDGSGTRVRAGVYFVRLRAGDVDLQSRILMTGVR